MNQIGTCGKSGWDGKVLVFATILLILILTSNLNDFGFGNHLFVENPKFEDPPIFDEIKDGSRFLYI